MGTKRKAHVKRRDDRALSPLLLQDDWHRYVVKPARHFLQPELAMLLHTVWDERLPHLFGRTGTWHGVSAYDALPYMASERIGLDRYPEAMKHALLLFEYIPGIPLDEIDYLDEVAAIELYAVYQRLFKRLQQIAARPVLHLDIKPSNILRLAAGGYAFIDWAHGSLGEHDGIVPGTDGYTKQGVLSASLARDRYALARTIISLLQDKPATTLRTHDVKSALRKLPADFRAMLKEDMNVAPAPTKKSTIVRDVSNGEDGPMTVIVIPWEEAKNKRNVRIQLDR